MGGNTSRCEEFSHVFSTEEKTKLQAIFSQVALSKKAFDYKDLRNYLTVECPEIFSKRLFRHLLHYNEHDHHASAGGGNVGGSIPFPSFVSSMAVLLKGSLQERAQLIILLATGDDKEPVSSPEMFELFMVLIKLYNLALSKSPQNHSWQNKLEASNYNFFSHFILRDLFFPEKHNKDHVKDEIPEQVYTEDDLEKWLAKVPLAVLLMEVVFDYFFPLNKLTNICFPTCETILKSKSLLDVASVVAVNSNLPSNLRKEWRQLYNSRDQGESFTLFVHQIQQKGPTVIVIQDKDGHIFGGFASQDWELNASFRGTSECFLFLLNPMLKCYLATGYNDHFMYLNQNQQTLPNGLGFGGQLEYFGIWLDKDFGAGSCGASCATYNCPQLSGQPQFEIDCLEVWAVGPLPKKEEECERVRGSVLDVDLEAKAMLEMLGRGPVSEGIREEDPTSDSPEEKNFILSHYEM